MGGGGGGANDPSDVPSGGQMYKVLFPLGGGGANVHLKISTGGGGGSKCPYNE